LAWRVTVGGAAGPPGIAVKIKPGRENASGT